jgi:hypothetical protein
MSSVRWLRIRPKTSITGTSVPVATSTVSTATTASRTGGPAGASDSIATTAR